MIYTDWPSSERLVWRDRAINSLASVASTWTSLAWWTVFAFRQSSHITECSRLAFIRLMCDIRTLHADWANETINGSCLWIPSVRAHLRQCCTTSALISGFAFFLFLFKSVNVESRLCIIPLTLSLFIVLPEEVLVAFLSQSSTSASIACRTFNACALSNLILIITIWAYNRLSCTTFTAMLLRAWKIWIIPINVVPSHCIMHLTFWLVIDVLVGRWRAV